MVYQIKDYSKPDAAQGRAAARQEVPFLFKAFETGQVRACLGPGSLGPDSLGPGILGSGSLRQSAG